MTAAEALVGHYQQTYELTYEMWKQRNRIFLLLLAVISVATILTFRAPQADSLLLDLIRKLLDVSDPARIGELRTSFPFGLLQSVLLVAVFYLMVNLYHRALYVLRNYSYLSRLEVEIRQQLNLPKASVAFTRESTFYWKGRESTRLGFVKWVYIAFLGALLVAFLFGRIVDDFRLRNHVLAFIDILIATPTLFFFFAYAKSSAVLDKEQAIVAREDRQQD